MKHPLLLQLTAFAGLAGLATAQGDFTFQINQAASSFTWSGTTSLGDIDEQPPNFNLSGTIVGTMDGGGNPVGSGGLPNDGDALITPNIHGEIPNPVFFLPPLATLDMVDVHVKLSSPAFGVSGSGAFSTQVTLHIISGTLVVDPLVGSQSVTDLAGLSSSPEPVSGTITWTGSGYRINAPISTAFAFAASGVSGSFTLDGTVVCNHTPEAPFEFCTSSVNSGGAAGALSSSGSTSLALGDLIIDATQLPSNVFGIFFYGPTQISLPFGDGIRCVGGSLQRLPPVNTGILGTASQLISNAVLPPQGQVAVGDRRNFQFWFRDVPAGNSGFNTSSAVTALFTP